MPAVKTAISLDALLLEQIDALADELDLPRSRVLARAAEEFVRRYENRRLLDQLDRAYGEENEAVESEEQLVRQAHRARLRRRLVEEPW